MCVCARVSLSLPLPNLCAPVSPCTRVQVSVNVSLWTDGRLVCIHTDGSDPAGRETGCPPAGWGVTGKQGGEAGMARESTLTMKTLSRTIPRSTYVITHLQRPQALLQNGPATPGSSVAPARTVSFLESRSLHLLTELPRAAALPPSPQRLSQTLLAQLDFFGSLFSFRLGVL